MFARPYALLLRTSLALAMFGGFGLGAYLVLSFAFGIALSTGAPALIQVHGQVQAVGFVVLFISAVGVQLFPRFHSTTIVHPERLSYGGLMTATGIVLRAISQPLEASGTRSVVLILSGALELGGVLLIVMTLGSVIRRSVNPDATGIRRVLPITTAVGLLGGLVLNLLIVAGLAGGGIVAPLGQDEALLQLELWAFATSMVFAVAGRVYPRFLILKPPREAIIPAAYVLWGVGAVGMALVWLLASGEPLLRAAIALVQLAGIALYLHALRVYESPARVSGMPHVTDPTRRWVRVAFGFLLVAALLNVVLPVYGWITGAVWTTTLSAARHAQAQGFLLPLIVIMASRILPGYSGYMMRRPRHLSALIWTLFVAAGIRVIAELSGGYNPGWGALVALGGLLGAGAFTQFAWDLWRTTRGAPSSI